MRKTLQTVCLLLLVTTAGTLQAADGPLLSLPLPALPADAEMLVLEVNLAPGQAAAPHRHNAHVFVYVLEGQVHMQVAGGPLQTLSPGDTLYENPQDIHAVSRNASTTEPAKFLVHIIKPRGAPVTVPATLP